LHMSFTIQAFLENIMKCKHRYLTIEKGKAKAGKSSANESVLVKTQDQEDEEIGLLRAFIQDFARTERIELEAASIGKRIRYSNQKTNNWGTRKSKNHYSTGNSMRGYPYTRNNSQYTRNSSQYTRHSSQYTRNSGRYGRNNRRRPY